MSYKKCIAIIVLIFGNLLMHGQSQNHVNNEINNFFHETLDVQSPVFEALDNEMYDEFIEDLNEVNTTKRHVENDLYIMTYNKSAVNVLFKYGNTSIRFDDESVKTLNEALNTE